MRVFVTGASGFVGSAVTDELLKAGHQVLGLVRSDKAAEELLSKGAEPHRGDLDNIESITSGAAVCDATIHTAFNHDFSRYKESCENDRRIIHALGATLSGTGKPLVITSGIGLLKSNEPVTEDDVVPAGGIIPRGASEEAAIAVAAQGALAYIVRLPPTVHGEGDHGFIPMLINMARQKGTAAFPGNGTNQWPAVHRLDAAVLYRLIIEKKPSQKVFHAVAEKGIPFKTIATAIGKGLHVETLPKYDDEIQQYFEWFTHFALMDCAASARKTIEATGWSPVHATLEDDLSRSFYFE